MSSKVLPLKPGPQKFEAFNVAIGHLDEANQVVEIDRVGVAFLKGNSKVFSLRLWMFSSTKYFVAPDDEDRTRYDILSLESYSTRDGEVKSNWHKVGRGEISGNYLRLKFYVLDREVYLSLFPKGQEPTGSVA